MTEPEKSATNQKSKEMVRYNINMLEFPAWFQHEEMVKVEEKRSVFRWTDIDGYIYSCGYKAPVKTDIIFLLYLLLKSEKNGYSVDIELSRFEVLKGCGFATTKAYYNRLRDSLKRWKMVGIEFQGTFYNGKEYIDMHFGIIDSWTISKDNKMLKVSFSPKFIEMMLGKGFFDFINFTEFKKLRLPLATRLYEILSKSFHKRDEWKIEATKLAKKIPLAEKYASHIVTKIKSAINRINESDCEEIFELSTKTLERGHVILTFKRINGVKKENCLKLEDIDLEEDVDEIIPDEETIVKDLEKLANLVPNARRSVYLIPNIRGSYERHGYDYVERNIKYSLKNAKRNFNAYLALALRDDYGLNGHEEAIAKEEENQKILRENDKKREENKKYEEDNKIAKSYLDGLSSEERQRIEAEAIENMDERARSIVSSKKMGFDVLLFTAMKEIVFERIKANNNNKEVMES